MSGHSKWHKIQHKKGKADKARSNLFTKLCRAVTVAAGQGGGDPDMNFSLRLAIEKAKAGNVPKDNIERAIKRGTGELQDGATIEEALYEGFGPGGSAFLVETMTDNKNRTVAEVKHTFTKHGGSLGGPGSVQWQFTHMGVVRITKEEQEKLPDWESVELAFMDAGADDIIESEFGVEIRSNKASLKNVLDVIKTQNITPEDSGLEWVAKEHVSVNEEVQKKVLALYDLLEELDDVKAVYTNI